MSRADRWKPWFGPVALVGGLIAGVIGGAVIVLIVHGSGSGQVTTLSPGETDGATLIQDLAFVVIGAGLASTVGRIAPQDFGLRPTARWRQAIVVVPLAFVVFLALSAAWLALVHASGEEKGVVKDLVGGGSTLAVLGAAALTCVVAPLCEEFVFRGLLFRSLRNWRGFWPAALITGALFGAVHGASAPAVDLLPLALFGVLLCALYQWSGSLYPCIALHAINNSISLSADLGFGWRGVELVIGALAAIALILWLVREAVPGDGRPSAI